MTDNFNFDDDFEYQEFKQDMDAKSKHLQRWQAEQAQKFSDKVFNDLWNETLNEEGLDLQTYGNLASQDPEHVKAELKKSMKSLIGNVKKGRKGQFVKQPQGGQMPQPPTEQEAQSKLDHYREISKKRTLTDNESVDVLDALFGADPLWKD
jgi:hypothetical protein